MDLCEVSVRSIRERFTQRLHVSAFPVDERSLRGCVYIKLTVLSLTSCVADQLSHGVHEDKIRLKTTGALNRYVPRYTVRLFD
jgi:hypothetical protein